MHSFASERLAFVSKKVSTEDQRKRNGRVFGLDRKNRNLNPRGPEETGFGGAVDKNFKVFLMLPKQRVFCIHKLGRGKRIQPNPWPLPLWLHANPSESLK